MDIKEKIREEMARRLKGQNLELTDDLSLLDSGIIDSGAVFELVEFVEKEFGVKVEDDEIVPEHFESFNAIALLVAGKG